MRLRLGLSLSAVIALGCTPVGDPGYTVAIRNDSELSLVVRGDRHAGLRDPVQWLLPPRSAGFVLMTIGPPREAQPMDYEIVEPSSCDVLGVQHVDFALAPNPGYSMFIVVAGPDLSLRLDTRTTSDPTIQTDLEETAACPAT